MTVGPDNEGSDFFNTQKPNLNASGIHNIKNLSA